MKIRLKADLEIQDSTPYAVSRAVTDFLAALGDVVGETNITTKEQNVDWGNMTTIQTGEVKNFPLGHGSVISCGDPIISAVQCNVADKSEGGEA